MDIPKNTICLWYDEGRRGGGAVLRRDVSRQRGDGGAPRAGRLSGGQGRATC